MARPRKIVETDKHGKKLAGALPDCFYKWKSDTDEEADTLLVYTTQSIKTKLEPSAFYDYPNGEKAVHYLVVDGSKEQKELFKLLNMNASHEVKPSRKKRITKAEKLAQVANGEVKTCKRRNAAIEGDSSNQR